MKMFPKPCHECYECGRWPLCDRCREDHACARAGGKRANEEDEMTSEELQLHKRLRDTQEFRLPWSDEL